MIGDTLIAIQQDMTAGGYGYILVDGKFKIIFVNDFCHNIFEGADLNRHKKSTQLLENSNAEVLKLSNKKLIDCDKYLEVNNRIVKEIHSVVRAKSISVSFVFFSVWHNEIQSLLINFVPVCNSTGKVVFIQIFITRYDYWGNTGVFNIDNKKVEPIKIMNKSNRPGIKLSPRQEEVVFLLSLGIGLRHAAQLLKISYGTLTCMIRDTICKKMGMASANTDLLIEKLVELGYNKLVPQSLCRPGIIILDSMIREKYFAEDVFC